MRRMAAVAKTVCEPRYEGVLGSGGKIPLQKMWVDGWANDDDGHPASIIIIF
jgi:hypothetical protein